MSVLDRYLLRSLLVNYLIGLAVMLSLYVVLDMFVNMDEFTEQSRRPVIVLGNMVDYYAPNLLVYFSQLSGIIVLFACGASLTRMRKMNELTAVLASGVSLFRIARPVLIFGVIMTGLRIIDTEALIPLVAPKLSRDHDDVYGQKAYEVFFLRDRDNALLSAAQFHPETLDLQRLLVLFRDEAGSLTATLEADQAAWEPEAVPGTPGRWRLQRGVLTRRVLHAAEGLGPRASQEISYPQSYESNLSPQDIQLRQASGWVRFLSLSELATLETTATADRTVILQTRHARIAAPMVSFLLLLLGAPFFLNRSPTDVLSDVGKCILVCGLCFLTSVVAESVRTPSESALAAWAPIFVFGPIAVVLFDRVRT